MSEEISNQDILVDFIRKYTTDNGYPPSTREMAAAMNFRSVESIHRLLRLLRDAGRVDWQPRKARTLRIVE